MRQDKKKLLAGLLLVGRTTHRRKGLNFLFKKNIATSRAPLYFVLFNNSWGRAEGPRVFIVLYIPGRAEGRRPEFEGRTISVFIEFLFFWVVNFDSFLPFFLYLMDSLLNRSYPTSSVTLPSSIGNSSRNSRAASNSAKRRIDFNTPVTNKIGRIEEAPGEPDDDDWW